MKNIYLMKQYHQKIMFKYVWIEKFMKMQFLFHLLQLHLTPPQILTHVDKYLLRHQI